MNRRTFFSRSATTVLSSASDPSDSRSSAYQKRLLKIPRTTTGLEPYTGPWGYDQAAHLLRRTMFGARKSDVDAILTKTMTQAVDMLLTQIAQPSPPIVYVGAQGEPTPAGQTWVNAVPTTNTNVDSIRFQWLLSWWIQLLLRQDISIMEKMTLFWHNHFSCEGNVVADARYSYKQSALLRQNALGNFKNLVKQITLDPAMLVYLNGKDNKKGSPNENYGRELQELFTIGKGPEIAPGNYTNYAESDVKTAARVLTGWGVDANGIKYQFHPNDHDPSDKTFSSDYGNTIIKGGAATEAVALRELDDLLNMIFAQNATSEYICKKLYRWFVYYEIDAAAEQNVIQPMANLLRINNFEIKPVMDVLLKSAHFFDPANMACILKNPADHIIGTLRFFPVSLIFDTDTRQQHWVGRTIRNLLTSFQMSLLNPPNVAGWSAYWQEPVYHEIWINSDTLQKQVKFTQDLTVDGLHVDENYNKAYIDVLEVGKMISDPSNATTLVNELARIILAVPIEDAHKTAVITILNTAIGNESNWITEWTKYKNTPTDTAPGRLRLQRALKYMFALAEYQLS